LESSDHYGFIFLTENKKRLCCFEMESPASKPKGSGRGHLAWTWLSKNCTFRKTSRDSFWRPANTESTLTPWAQAAHCSLVRLQLRLKLADQFVFSFEW